MCRMAICHSKHRINTINIHCRRDSTFVRCSCCVFVCRQILTSANTSMAKLRILWRSKWQNKLYKWIWTKKKKTNTSLKSMIKVSLSRKAEWIKEVLMFAALISILEVAIFHVIIELFIESRPDLYYVNCLFWFRIPLVLFILYVFDKNSLVAICSFLFKPSNK